MKRSIKVATLTFFVTSLLAGCSSEGPAPVAQEITVNPESKVTTLDESFELSTNASTATWSLEDNLCGALLSATEGKSVSVSATSVGTVAVVAAASGYTTVKVALTFNPKVQEITVNPASAKVYLDESFELETNLASANWELQENNTGASLSAESGKSVTISGAVTAGTLKAVATAEGATTAEVLLTFEALLPQILSTDPASMEVFKGKTITVTTDASSAGWSLENNTASAKLISSAQGKSVTIQGDSVGTVDVVAKSEHHADARVTLSFVEPHWTDDEKAQMSAALHGEVLPYPLGVGDMYSGFEGGTFYAYNGSAIKASVLSDYAKNFSSAEGWVKVPVYASQPSVELYYIFEKEVEVEGDRRFAHVEFLSLNPSSGSIVENGIFYLEASDPYIYSEDEVTALFTDAKTKLGIESDLDVPVLSAHHYSFFVPSSNAYAISSWYEVELGEAESAVELYKSTLEATEDYNIYADSVEGGYVAEEKKGAFSIILVGNGVDGVDVTLKKGRHYASEWPSKEVAALVESYESETVVPAFEGAARYSFEEFPNSSGEKILAVYCHGIESEEPFAGYPALLEGWTLFGELFDGYYVADSADGKIGVQFSFSAGTLSIYVASNTFEHEFPSNVFDYAKMLYGIDSEYEVPELKAGGYYPFAVIEEDEETGEPYLNAGVECYAVPNPESKIDAGYGEILANDGWLVSEPTLYSGKDEEGYSYSYVVFGADTPDSSYSLVCVYYPDEDVFRIVFSADLWFFYEWPAELVEEFTDAVFSNSHCVPKIEAEYYDFDESYGILSCYGVEVSAESPDAGYGALLEKAGFTLMGEGEEGGFKYWKANSPADVIEIWGMEFTVDPYGIAYWVEGDVLYVQYMQYAWLESFDKLPVEEISALYKAGGIEGDVVIPEYVISSEQGYFELSREYEEDGALVFYAYNSTSEDLATYEELLLANGWNLVPPADDESGRAEAEEEPYSATYQFGETLAFIDVVDYSESEDGFVGLVYYFEEEAILEYPVEAIQDYYYEAYGLDVPAALLGEYEIASEDGYFAIEEDGYLYVYAVNSDLNDMKAYISSMEKLGWVASHPDEDYPEDTKLVHSSGLSIYVSEYDGYIMIQFYYQAPASDEFPVSDIEDYLAEVGFEGSIPSFGDYAVASESAEFDAYVEYSGDLCIDIYETTLEEQQAYVLSLIKAGWTLKGDDPTAYDGVYLEYGETGVFIYVKSYLDTDYECVSVYIYYQAPVPKEEEFPLEDVNAFLSSYGLGFQISSADAFVDPTGNGFGYVEDTYVSPYGGQYDYVEITVDGDQTESWKAAIEAFILSNGFELDEDESEEGVYVYYNDSWNMVEVYYSSVDGSTHLIFME